jgi:hypothetical protein
MDPNTTLEELRELIANGFYDLDVDRFEALDQWLSRGGFLPADGAAGR